LDNVHADPQHSAESRITNHESRITIHDSRFTIAPDVPMPTRRNFLQISLAAAALSRTNPVMRRDVSTPPERVRMRLVVPTAAYAVLADERFPDSLAVADDAQAAGHRVVRFRGDITGFWFDDLSLQWKKQRAAICGVTAHGPLFCLERLAWDHGMRVTSVEWSGPLASWVIS
jgi:hypothetical protein